MLEFIATNVENNTQCIQLNQLFENLNLGYMVSNVGPDEELRLPYITLQGLIEYTLVEMAKNSHISNDDSVRVDILCEIIHTQKPTTPLRISPEELDSILDERNDNDRNGIQFTVSQRQQILLDLLEAKNTNLITIYNADEATDYFLEISNCYENLIDCPLETNDFNYEHSGATIYLRCADDAEYY
ncbi:MAG: hypothetical protein P857_199 [Candidatus Xenolissoclinum pacificiensis L6]|uniref:Uncharacterized protein n=1 Tax=Candidatus Xenolissoclinum pacificiensis L6 TaxID=1401685 RepID=W2UZF9_9RICK|nr:MAG: hypothetical protein P857_199 [Candidatus Xenolissoclinum pacificiensis L6]